MPVGDFSSAVSDPDAETRHRRDRVDARSGAGEGTESRESGEAGFRTWRSRESRRETVLHLGVGDAGIEVDVLGPEVIGQERALLVRACAIRLAGAAGDASGVIGEERILVHW